MTQNSNGRIMTFIAFIAQLITIVWTIASMNAAIANLSTQLKEVTETIKIINTQLQSNSIDIKLLQQGVKK